MYLARRADGTTGIKVLDFGIAKMSSEDEGEIPQSLTSSSAFLGSPAYMSPEQLLCARDVGMQADIWSLGAIMHKLLAGRPPFLAQTMLQVCSLIVSSPPGRVRDLRSDVPAELENVILRCLRREPADRFRNVGELARALAPFAPAAALASVDRVSSALALGSARDAATRRRALAKRVAMGVAGVALVAGATAGLVAMRSAKHAQAMSWARSSVAAIHAPWDDHVAAAAPPPAMPSALALASRAVQPPSEVASPPPAAPETSASVSTAASAHVPVATHATPRRPLAAVPKVGHAEFGGRK
jgi:serine/threonine-protein kinase